MLRRAALQTLRLAKGSQPATEAPCQLCWSQQIQSQANKWIRSSQSLIQQRAFSADSDDDEVERRVASTVVKKLAEEIMALNLLEVADLTEILQKRLNIQIPAFGGGMAMAAMPGGAPQAGAAAAAPPPEKEAEKTEFDLKLDGFDAASKIKVIKEVRGMTDLGLKEAKELVEKAPTVLKTGLKKEEAEELKKKLEAAGAKIVLE